MSLLAVLSIMPSSAEETPVLIDDSDPGFGDLTNHPGGTPVQAVSSAFNGSAHHSLIALMEPPAVHVSWTFADLDPAKEYDVAVTWSLIYPPGNLTGDAAYTITGATVETTHLVHTILPAADYVHNDGSGLPFNFQTLARVRPKSDGTIVLGLRDDDGDALFAVVADAALVCAVEPSSPTPLVLAVDSLDTDTHRIHLLLQGMAAGKSYRILATDDLDADFLDIGVTVTADTPQPFAVAADELAELRRFFMAEEVE